LRPEKAASKGAAFTASSVVTQTRDQALTGMGSRIKPMSARVCVCGVVGLT
jgi:hypothetical protein